MNGVCSTASMTRMRCTGFNGLTSKIQCCARQGLRPSSILQANAYSRLLLGSKCTQPKQSSFLQRRHQSQTRPFQRPQLLIKSVRTSSLILYHVCASAVSTQLLFCLFSFVVFMLLMLLAFIEQGRRRRVIHTGIHFYKKRVARRILHSKKSNTRR